MAVLKLKITLHTDIYKARVGKTHTIVFATLTTDLQPCTTNRIRSMPNRNPTP